jgi:CubicO group peptidase (beta-lactamase class C family)
MRRLRWFTGALAVLAFSGYITAYGQPPSLDSSNVGESNVSHLSRPQLNQLASSIAKALHRYHLPGGALAVVADGHIELVQGFGVSNLKTKQAVTGNTLYAVGSLTKAMTAVAIMQLRDRGLLDLGDPVQKYLPWFRLADESASSQITIYDLLTHTSGIPSDADVSVFRGLKPDDTSIEAGVRALRSVRMDGPPGAHFEYSHMNYAVLGLIVEKVSGQPFDDYIKSNILQPLGMSKTTFDPKPSPLLASKYLLESGNPIMVPPLDKRYAFADPAGSRLVSSADDMARFLEAELGSSSTTILSDSDLQDVFNGSVKLPRGLGGESYGFAWVQSHANGVAYDWITGVTPGSFAAMVVVPSRKLGAVILAGGSGVPNQYCISQIASILTSTSGSHMR